MMHDLRFAVRQLWKAPGFTIAAVLVLTLGIGVNTAVFSLVHTMLFAPPGYARPNELVQIFSQDTKNPKSYRAFSYPILNDIRAQNSVFTGVAGYNVGMVGVGEKNNTRRTFASVVTANYLDVLGVAPVIGRGFALEEEQPGRAASVALVSYGYWTRHNHDDSILGSQVLINGRSYTIIGVLPQTFTGTLAVLSPEVWVPLSAMEFIAPNPTNDPAQNVANRASQQLLLMGRFKPGVTAPTAEAALKTLAANLERAYPVEHKDQTLVTAPLSRFSISDDPPDDSQLGAIAPMLLGMASPEPGEHAPRPRDGAPERDRHPNGARRQSLASRAAIADGRIASRPHWWRCRNARGSVGFEDSRPLDAKSSSARSRLERRSQPADSDRDAFALPARDCGVCARTRAQTVPQQRRRRPEGTRGRRCRPAALAFLAAQSARGRPDRFLAGVADLGGAFHSRRE